MNLPMKVLGVAQEVLSLIITVSSGILSLLLVISVYSEHSERFDVELDRQHLTSKHTAVSDHSEALREAPHRRRAALSGADHPGPLTRPPAF